MQLSYAISGVLGVHTAEGSFFAPPQRAIWIPAQLEHEVVTSTRAEMRSLYIRGDACAWAPTRCRVLEVTPLARELIKSFCELPVDYPEGDSAESRLVQVLLDQLRLLPEVAFSLPMPREPRLLRLCQALIDEPTQSLTMGDWAQRLGKTRLSAEQGGARKGRLECDVRGERVVISGKAALYMSGTLHL